MIGVDPVKIQFFLVGHIGVLVAGRPCQYLGRVEFWPPRARITPLVKDMLLELAPWLPYKTRMQIANIWLFRRSLLKKLRQTPRASALVCSTTAAAMSSCGSSPGMLPGLAEAILNVRLLTGENERMLTGWLDVLFAEKDLPLKTEVLSSVEPSRISDYHSREFDEMKSAVRDVFGDLPVIPALLCSQSDARFYEPLCPCVFRFSPFVAAPEDKQAAHGENEKIAIPSLGTGIQFYRRLVERMALSEDN